jgi:GxxExxY protein
MSELIYKDESYRIIGICMEVPRELGKGHSEIVYKDALECEFAIGKISWTREQPYEIHYKAIILHHKYCADFIVFDRILLEAKAVEKLTEAHVRQVLNYLACSKLKLGLLGISVKIRSCSNESSCENLSV